MSKVEMSKAEQALSRLSDDSWVAELSNLYLQFLTTNYGGNNDETNYTQKWLEESKSKLLKPYPLNLNASEPSTFGQWMDFYVKLSIQLHLKFEFEIGEIKAKELYITAFEHFSRIFGKDIVSPTLARLMPFYLLNESVLEGFSSEAMKHIVLDKKNELSLLLNRLETLEQTVLEQDFLLDNYKEETERALNVKSKFLNNMSHEIRTPMTTILGYSELLLKHNDNAERVGDFAEVIQNNAAQLMDLMDDFIEVSKLESGISKPIIQQFRFSELFEFQIDVQSLFPDNSAVALVVDIERTISELIEADKEKILQILVHLVENARRFTKEGEVHVYFDIDRRDKVINLKVTDQNSRISAHETDEIFEEFYHLEHDEASYSGTSLGLSIVKRLVALLDGTIELKPNAEQGSVISVQIPINIINKANLQRVAVPRAERRGK